MLKQSQVANAFIQIHFAILYYVFLPHRIVAIENYFLAAHKIYICK